MALKNIYQLYALSSGQTRPSPCYVYAADESTARSKLAARLPDAEIQDNVFEYSGANGFTLGILAGEGERKMVLGTYFTTVIQRERLKLEDVLTKADLAEIQADI
ncbi:hypothetical protein [Blastopirellula marina]|uniref:Uncharacterized protein n=1 Tax=Blastopirellula marina DSM 3645 TaxID=314230 RepID=A3ZPQ8_9BACT|nr:hypothetical protein [Blastopirellula marina]EAQ81736.1 hypothetical protein DSM3645_29182 [Blastopirellula marina DSM 3645]